MVERLDKAQLLARKEVVAPPSPAGCEDHSFELPAALHITTGALFIGFVSVLSLAFANPELAVPWAVFVSFIVAFFAVPAIFVRSSPKEGASCLRWSDFMERGIAIEHGRCSGREATVLVLALPLLIFAWGVAVAVIVATL